MRFRFPVILYLEFADLTSPWTLNSESRVLSNIYFIGLPIKILESAATIALIDL